MKKNLYLLLLLLAACATPGFMPTEEFIQSNNYQEIAKDDAPEGYAELDRAPMYPHGLQGITALITENVVYPQEAVEKNISGVVHVSYVVEKDGYVGRIEIVQGLHPSVNKEAIRVIKLMERWVPAIQKGKAVPVRFTQPVRFSFR